MKPRDRQGPEEEHADAGPALAAVDIGSNSVRLELGHWRAGRYHRIDYVKETVRLGAGIGSDGALSAAAIESGVACLRRFSQRIEGFPADRVRAVATQTLREASNRGEFLQAARRALGRRVEVISGDEEARLIWVGVAALQPGREPRLVVDIGGRSTEVIVGTGAEPRILRSVEVGCVGLSLRCFRDGRITPSAFDQAGRAAAAALEPALAAVGRERWTQSLGSSGTAGAVSQALRAAGLTDGRIVPAALRWCIDHCLRAGHVDRISIPGVAADRRAVLPAGVAILEALMSRLAVAEMRPARGALRHGVLAGLHAARRCPAPAVVEETAAGLSR